MLANPRKMRIGVHLLCTPLPLMELRSLQSVTVLWLKSMMGVTKPLMTEVF